MFNRPIETVKTYLIGALAVAVLGLGVWSRYQHSNIVDLKAENQTQAQTIKQQEEANKALNIALQQERQAVIEQQQRNEEIEKAASENAETVKTIIKTQPCYRTKLPRSALERLYK
ncbi:DUF2570 family protein [Aggregatibacter actinomycetemcomitans]|uniref:DUF2570 family protein n=2 Tax=Aggregatibacter actinomycetemcomitans TaxID=714 RepID=UPI00197B63F3|nr:DUF2570 family protein [Aggregatibacter actinomycetemcomitans]MBN6067439.1 DUF2570 family protein [Aggregatibacter actinomycetemcomitans]MBN6086933.1 DUF2570 family protein [Aggregatibacter actinomycetemcomitans]